MQEYLSSFPTLPHFHRNSFPFFIPTMAHLQSPNTPVFQEFKCTDRPTVRLRTHICEDTRQRYIFWSDIQDTFEDIDHLRDQKKDLVLFMIDNNGEL